MVSGLVGDVSSDTSEKKGISERSAQRPGQTHLLLPLLLLLGRDPFPCCRRLLLDASVARRFERQARRRGGHRRRSLAPAVYTSRVFA